MKLTREKSIEAVLVICTGLIVIYYFFDNRYFLIVAMILGVAAIISTFLAKQIAWLWYKIAELLGMINGFILLSILFYIILTPIAWLSKIFNKDVLKLKKKTDISASYYVDRDLEYSGKDLENPW